LLKDRLPVRIVYLIEQLAPGGAERQLVELVRRLDRERFAPSIVTGWGTDAALEEVRSLGVAVALVRGRVGGGKLSTLGVIQELRSVRPRLIHSQMFTANVWGAAAKVALRKPALIAGFRGFAPDLTRFQQSVERIAARAPDHIICNSRSQGEALLRSGIDPRRLSVIPNGIDVNSFQFPPDREGARRALGIAAGAPVIGMVASFCRRKRWDVFLRAVAQLHSRQTVEVLCVGDGELRQQSEALAGSLGISGRVRFLGERHDVPLLLPAFDLLALSSDAEGQPNVVLEAMATGIPVVATAVSGTPEVIDDGRTGFLVPAGDSDEMAHRMDQLLSDPDTARAMGAAGRAKVSTEFDIDRCVASTVAVYDRLLNR
jgi:glycosyltransferase involved in cell wall biosynthesis